MKYAFLMRIYDVSRAGSSMRLVRLKPQGPGSSSGPDRPVQKKSREKIYSPVKFNISK